jgi:hypothetical protein
VATKSVLDDERETEEVRVLYTKSTCLLSRDTAGGVKQVRRLKKPPHRRTLLSRSASHLLAAWRS